MKKSQLVKMIQDAEEFRIRHMSGQSHPKGDDRFLKLIEQVNSDIAPREWDLLTLGEVLEYCVDFES